MGEDRAELLIVDDADALAREAAARLAHHARECVDASGRFTLALSGGSTPRRLYTLLADPDAPYRAAIPWAATHVFWGDERCVPPDDPQSNYRMLPNFFPDADKAPEFNSVDASLWYLIAVHELLGASASAGRPVAAADRRRLQDAFGAILTGYARGTRYGIRADADGLLAAGERGVQLTWMDAKVGDWVVTPRIGKPVEVQALWINALRIAGGFTEEFAGLLRRATASFADRFWNEEAGCLYDVVDVDHVAGTADATFRPNQIYAVGGLPFPLLEGERARRIVDAVESRLVTALGLRTLPPDHPDYHPRYAGGVLQRDGAYHQGTAWPYLTGAFVEAWIRVRGGGSDAKNEARRRFLAPLIAHLDAAGLSHVSEVADGDAPHAPGGCPFQAWSVGETLRIDRVLLAEAPVAEETSTRERQASGGDRRSS